MSATVFVVFSCSLFLHHHHQASAGLALGGGEGKSESALHSRPLPLLLRVRPHPLIVSQSSPSYVPALFLLLPPHLIPLPSSAVADAIEAPFSIHPPPFSSFYPIALAHSVPRFFHLECVCMSVSLELSPMRNQSPKTR